MYTAVKAPRRWNNIAPWIAILLLCLILFAIAATIVISLITIYLPARDISAAAATSGRRSVTVPLPSDSNVKAGSIGSSAPATVKNQIKSAVDAHPIIKNKANVNVHGVTGNTGKRKRQSSDQRITSVTIDFEAIFTGLCTSNKCKAQVLAIIIELFKLLKLYFDENGSDGSASNNTTPSIILSNDTISTPTILTNGTLSTPLILTNLTNATNGTGSTADENVVTGDISIIQQYWANLRPYTDNTPDYFDVENTGLPNGCQVEQVFNLHRHAARFPSSSDDTDIKSVLTKLKNTTGTYTGPLAFLNTYSYQLGTENLLPIGTDMAYKSGVDFWTKYGRILYNASQGQNYYDPNGQTKPVLRCNTIQRVTDTAVAWANGFFTLYNATDKYSLVKIPYGVNVNNTLASFYSCFNFITNKYGTFNIQKDLYKPVNNYLNDTVKRLQQYAPSDVTLTTFDAFIMQELCPFEFSVFNSSDFCSLFTVYEWKGYRYTNDLYIYNGYSFGSPSGRALGIGVLQELIARLQNQTITVSNTSVNTSFDGNTDTFPLGQKFYLETTHDFMLVGLLTAMSLDYFHQPLSYDAYPPDENRHFKTTNIIPYAARIITEKIGCASANPTETDSEDTQYTPTTNGYSPSNATYKFIRMRLNSGILPLATIRGGYCSGRTDGLCSLENFLASQANATTEANYGTVCRGTYTYNASLFTGDGNYFPQS